VLSLSAWTIVTVIFVWLGGARANTFVADLHDPDRGFAIAYIP
jgi:hypothetical protein